MTKLSLANLPALSKTLKTPAYRRRDLTAGIVHIGVGNFHRAHLAVYLDELFNKGLDRDWAIIGAGVTPFDEKTRQVLASQDYLTTVVEQDNDGSSARIIGSMVGFIPPDDRGELIAQMTDPRIRIVSLTITEGGYMINPATGMFDPSHPAIVRDAENPGDPASAFGLILSALMRRKAQGVAPFTVMSCDNVPHNGVVTRNAVAGLARLIDPPLAQWVEMEVAFPNAMVDRITPATSDRERAMIKSAFGVEDDWPVFCEAFRQWVVEDVFPAGRPRFELVGAEFVHDVTPWEYMKIRILNGGHAVIAYAGGLLDVHYVHEAMQHPVIHAFLEKVELEEIVPTVPPVPNTDTRYYYKLIERRFSNPKIGDTIRRLCFDGSNRQPKFIVPPVADRLKDGLQVEGLALESALWCRYCAGTTDSGKTIEPNDPNWNRLNALALQAKSDADVWLGMRDIYGEVGASLVFATAFAKWLAMLWDRGVEATLRHYVAR